MIRIPALFAAFLAAAACTSSPAPPAAGAVRGAGPVEAAAGGGLPAQRLAPGECGLFLWSVTAPRTFVFFARAASGTAELWYDEKVATLLEVDAYGDIFGQFLTASEYVSREGHLEVSLTFRPGERLEQGQRVEAGRLVIRGRDGWERVQPVSGVSACLSG
jgi:hypothetical protein